MSATGGMREAFKAEVQPLGSADFLTSHKEYVVKQHLRDIVDLYVTNYESEHQARKALVDKVHNNGYHLKVYLC